MSIRKNLLVLLFFLTGICYGQEKTAGVLENDQFSYTGFINQKIPVTLDLTILGDYTVTGKISYLNTKPALPISIIGTYNQSESVFTLAEYEKSGNISGLIRATLKNLLIEGEWGSTKSDASYPLSLTFKAHHSIKPQVPASQHIEGEYAYHYGETGYDGVIKITREKNGTYAYAIGTVTGDKTRDLANASGSGLALQNNQLMIEVNPSCRFSVTFYDGFLKIASLNKDADSCGFTGANATLRGVYLKIR
ncbi:hypothetical protein TH53_14020 [Pedobacter lusitanus]|uniref:Uncharacterized protein n=1 Tax=Pedobacter lusitanus TaxID=1503925 RepID=A0A0D0GKD8_9SPHI|nr:hypothetical protein [Pedobacter lusitanus]KIO76650.1 hypothetical protein TH53_14020 [Pedobacter lusitanus]